jgi:hypothetical protein
MIQIAELPPIYEGSLGPWGRKNYLALGLTRAKLLLFDTVLSPALKIMRMMFYQISFKFS